MLVLCRTPGETAALLGADGTLLVSLSLLSSERVTRSAVPLTFLRIWHSLQ